MVGFLVAALRISFEETTVTPAIKERPHANAKAPQAALLEAPLAGEGVALRTPLPSKPFTQEGGWLDPFD